MDPTPARREWAKQFGADLAVSPEEAQATVEGFTEGLGADVAIEAVGIPETFEQCTELVRPGGHVANVGVHGKPATLHLETLWIKNVTITTGLVDTDTIPTLLRAIQGGQLEPTRFTSHRFALDQAMEAYDTFARAGETNALKVLSCRRQPKTRPEDVDVGPPEWGTNVRGPEASLLRLLSTFARCGRQARSPHRHEG